MTLALLHEPTQTCPQREIDHRLNWRVVWMGDKEPRKPAIGIQDEHHCQSISVSDHIGHWKETQKDSTVERKTLKKANLEFANLRNNKSTSERMSFGQMRQNWNFLARHISSVFKDKRKNEAVKEKNTALNRKSRGRLVMFGVCFAVSSLNLWKGTMKSEVNQGILMWNILPRFRKLCLICKSWVLQQNNDPKQS